MTVDTQYAFAVSRVRAIEKKLLDKNRFDRMIDAKTPEESLKLLLEAGYGLKDGEGIAVYEYEKLLMEEQRKVYNLLKEIAPEPEAFNLFLLKNDYHNIKVIIKSELLRLQTEDILVSTGSIDKDRLKTMIQSRDIENLPPVMKNAIEDSFDYYNRTGDPQFIDIILDRACFAHMKEEASRLDNAFVTGLVELLIDLMNLKSFFRLKKLGKTREFLSWVLIPGGRLSKELFLMNFDAPVEQFSESARFTQYSRLIEQAVAELARGKFTGLERLLDDYAMSYIKKARYKTLGIEPLIAFLWAKETEIRNARIVMVGKINDIPAETIRERLREAYV